MYGSICITGVDGTGKSTMVNKTRDLFPENIAVVQYMGLKSWETKFARMSFESNGLLFRKFKRLATIHELRYRIRKYRSINKIVIFDRYTYEQYIENNLIKKSFKNAIINLLYKYFLFDHIHRPTITFYLSCSLETSILRKDDIVSSDDIHRLNRMKTLLDTYYINQEDIVVINTDEMLIDDTIEIIKKKIGDIECFNSLMS